ncbi:flagellar basal body L-ring protein FlgH [Altererythrobacter sp. Root672]|uniref:flagellar basal body L-ring protein FlgH n=1 Tax=Altererythrobacter sp. Root672 TaxID=1736584 RepID=UPI0006F6C010|nr:flagellar basal body L-ring protein FlgH [Altererythrobacter sp. Root672]KRA84555.1 flagellar biosynthesis protein FlgH [Altererythrobacter sp. Root672]
MNRKLPISALCLVMLAGCAADQRPAGFAASLPPPPAAAPVQANGAIFNASTGYAPLHFGQRAHRVGDLVTVVLMEKTTTSKSADSTQARDGSIALRPPTVGPFAFNPNVLNSGGSSSFNGGGDASQTSSLRGDLTVTIAEVRPNGTALVKGEKVMQFSQGEEWVQLAGIIRLADIDQDNRVASQRVADAQITYAGKGAVQRASREGWLSRFFNTVTPF